MYVFTLFTSWEIDLNVKRSIIKNYSIVAKFLCLLHFTSFKISMLDGGKFETISTQ